MLKSVNSWLYLNRESVLFFRHLMKIVFFSHYFPPEGNAPASRTYEHCKRWVAAGHKVTVITCAPNVPDGVVYEGFRNRILPQREVVDGIKVIRTWTYVAANSGGIRRILNYVSYMFSAVFSFLFFTRRPDVVVATSPQFFCGWAGVISSRLKWCRFVLEIRDIWPESIVTVGAMREGVLVRILASLECLMYRSAAHIVTVGYGYRENIIAKVDVADRTSVVTNGVDLEFFTPKNSSNEFRSRYELGDKFVCSYVGTIGMAHGLSVVVRAAKKLKEIQRDDIVFCLVGDGASRAALEAEANEAAVSSMIRMTGLLRKSEMTTVLASSDCLLVHLKKTELFETVIPSKMFEAMAMGRPLIMGVQGESADIVKRSNSGIQIEPENEDDLVAAVLKLCDNTMVYDNLSSSGRPFVSENYSRDVLAAAMLLKLERVAGVKNAA